MAVYTSYAAATAPHFNDADILGASLVSAYNPNVLTKNDLMPGGMGFKGATGNYNFNDNLPSAPGGNINVKWQADPPSVSPRNISAYIPTSASVPSTAAANNVFAGPVSGGAISPVFRALVSADIPANVALAGSPTTTTQAVTDNSTNIATTAFVKSAYRLKRIFTIFASQTYTPTSDIRALWVEATGNGGAGGGTPACTSGNATAAGGGGSGSYSASWITSVLSSYVVTIPAAATCTAGSGGANGGDVTFGSTVIAKGGSGGAVGPTAGTVPATGASGAGGIVGTGDVAIAGNVGSRAVVISGSLAACGGGGPGPLLNAGMTYPQDWALTGASLTGLAGGIGGGGQGAIALGAFAALAGGNGGTGFVRIWEFV